jgi:hypothetical protein
MFLARPSKQVRVVAFLATSSLPTGKRIPKAPSCTTGRGATIPGWGGLCRGIRLTPPVRELTSRTQAIGLVMRSILQAGLP